MTTVFADSFYFIALLNRHDRSHRAALAYSRAGNSRFLTTHWVFLELADALCGPQLRSTVHRFLLETSANEHLTLIGPDPLWYERGLDLFGRRPDKAWSLTDCISFAVMREHGLADALTGDHHFEQAGFRALLRDG